MDVTNPLLLTLSLDNQAQQYFNQLRQQHFPADRNFLDAHLMLFHQLPPNEEKIIADIENAVVQYQPMQLTVSQPVSIGRGVAYKIESRELSSLHRELQQQWAQWLIPQDTQRLWPHITVQNRVTPDEAKLLQSKLSAEFEPFDITGTGLALWEYKGGPWEFLRSWNFQS